MRSIKRYVQDKPRHISSSYRSKLLPSGLFVRYVSSTGSKGTSSVGQETQIRTSANSFDSSIYHNDKQNITFSNQSNDTTSSWSSPNDLVARNAFTKDHVRLWTLLEAFIVSKNFKRAESILIGLSGMASQTDMTLAVNKFLLKLVESNAENPIIAKEWLSKISQQVPSFRQNSVTDATLLLNLYTAGEKTQMKELIQDHVNRGGNIKTLLSHVDVLPVRAIQNIIKVSSNTIFMCLKYQTTN